MSLIAHLGQCEHTGTFISQLAANDRPVRRPAEIWNSCRNFRISGSNPLFRTFSVISAVYRSTTNTTAKF